MNSLIVGIQFDRQEQKRRITERLHSRLNQGMIDEVKILLEKGISPEDLIYYGLEYKFITQYVTGLLSYDKMVELLNIAIHQFSKRQNTWFRKMERDGFKIQLDRRTFTYGRKIETSTCFAIVMEIKGTSVRGTYDFVKKHFPDRFDLWINEMPESTRVVMSNLILTSKWYPIEEGLIIPIETISRLFYNGDTKYAAHFMGRYHAENTLTGIYKFFIKLNSPRFVIERGIEVLNTYFRPCTFNVTIKENNITTISITNCPTPHITMEASIAGWTERAIEISGGKNVQTEIVKSLTRNDDSTEIVICWEL